MGSNCKRASVNPHRWLAVAAAYELTLDVGFCEDLLFPKLKKVPLII